MASMAIIRCLGFAVLRTAAAFDQRHLVDLPGHFIDLHELVRRSLLDAPQQFAALRRNHLIADLEKFRMTIDARLPHRQFVRIGNGSHARRSCKCAVTRLALNVLRVFFRSVNVPGPHRLLRRVTIDTVEFVLAFGKIRNRLIVLDEASTFGRHQR